MQATREFALLEIPSVYLASILALGITAQWLAWRLRVPAIVLLLAFGFLGRYVGGPPDELIPQRLMFPAVSLAVGLILFEGGLTLRLRDIRDTGRVVLRLVTTGLFVTWVFVGSAAYWLLGFSVPMAALLGALLTVSGPTVIVPLVRNIRLKRRIGSLVKWEGIVNDPIGAVLAALVFTSFFGEGAELGGEHWFRGLGLTILIGALLGGSAAWVIIQLLRRFLVPDYLQNPVILATVVMLFAVSNYLQRDSGLVTVTLLGIALANQRTVTVKQVIQFKENLSVLLISTLFIVLAASVDVSIARLASLGWPAVLFFALLFVIRPLAVLMATVGSELTWNERLLLSWIHPRGIVAAAVASLLALELAGTEFAAEADRFVLVTFLTIVCTVVVYGLTLAPLARRLNLASPEPQGILFAGASPLVREIALAVKQEGFAVVVVDTNHQNAAAARMAGLSVHFASIGSEYVRDEIDLSDIGRLLAMTPNDEVNTLAAMEFAEHFGGAGVYQLAAPEPTSQHRDRVAAHRRGRTLFRRDATYEFLTSHFAEGAKIKKTQLSADFTFENFSAHHGPSAIVLFLVDSSGKLIVKATDEVTSAKSYPKVIALVDPTEAAKPAATAEDAAEAQ
jgi:NhaP-type Na+/H+ or K+/H+ antiporter